jgi:hypothetical protein
MCHEEMDMTTDDQQRIAALLAERAELIRERAELAVDLVALLDVARRVRDEASRVGAPAEPCLANALDDVLERFDTARWRPPRPVQVQAAQEQPR